MSPSLECEITHIKCVQGKEGVFGVPQPFMTCSWIRGSAHGIIGGRGCQHCWLGKTNPTVCLYRLTYFYRFRKAQLVTFHPYSFPLTSFLGQPTASHCPFGCDDLLHPHFLFGCANLYYTCVFLCFGYAYLCLAVLVAAYSFFSSYLLFCTLPQRGCTNYCI